MPSTVIGISFVSSLLLIPTGCRSPWVPIRASAIDVQSFCEKTPSRVSRYFRLQRVPDTNEAERITRQADDVVDAVCQWLGFDTPIPPACLLIFSPQEPQGRAWLEHNHRSHEPGGGMLTPDKILIVVGDPNEARFWTILRHEAAHYAVRATLPTNASLPFWWDDGIACLFETGVDDDHQPLPNPERLALLHYLIQTRSTLNLKACVAQTRPSIINGQTYAKVWGIMAYLYHQGRSPRANLHGLSTSSEPSLTLFETTLLTPHQDLQAFETGLKQWVLEKSQ